MKIEQFELRSTEAPHDVSAPATIAHGKPGAVVSCELELFRELLAAWHCESVGDAEQMLVHLSRLEARTCYLVAITEDGGELRCEREQGCGPIGVRTQNGYFERLDDTSNQLGEMDMKRNEVVIKGAHVPDDGWAHDLGALPQDTSWWEVPLPACPDCGGDMVWHEAGHVPGTRKCNCGGLFEVKTGSGRVWVTRAWIV